MRLGLDAGKDTLDLAVELGIRGVPISADRLARDGVGATLAPLRVVTEPSSTTLPTWSG